MQRSTRFGSTFHAIQNPKSGTNEKDGAQVDGQHAVPLVLGELEQWPDFGNPRVIEQHINAPPTLEGEIKHPLDVCCTSNIHLDRGLTKLVSKGLFTPFTSANNNRAPSRAIRRAQAAPMPLAAPVTRA